MAHRGRCRSQGSFYFEFGFDVDFNDHDILYNDHGHHDHDHGDHDDDDNHGDDDGDGDDHDDDDHDHDDQDDDVLRWKQYGSSLMTPLLPRVKIPLSQISQSVSQKF